MKFRLTRLSVVASILAAVGVALVFAHGHQQRTLSVPPNHPNSAGLGTIEHIVFIIKENRSFDNYFGTFPGADGAASGKDSSGALIRLGHTPDETPYDIGHNWEAAQAAMNGGGMDHFDL